MSSERSRQLELTLNLAGFALSHAVWSICEGETLCTMAFAEAGESRELLRFEADTIHESIDLARVHLTKQQPRIQRWALIFDGYLTDSGKQQRLDALIVQVWCGDILLPARIGQKYKPRKLWGRFYLIGEPEFLNTPDSLPKLDVMQQWLRKGIEDHPEAAKRWKNWQQG